MQLEVIYSVDGFSPAAHVEVKQIISCRAVPGMVYVCEIYKS